MNPLKKVENNTRKCKECEIRFFGIPIARYGREEVGGITEEYFKIFPKSFEHAFLDKVIQKIARKHDFVLLLRANGNGDTYLACLLWKELVRKNKAKSPCIVFHRRIFEDVIRVFDEKTPLYFTEDLTYHDYNRSLIHDHITYRGIKFVVWPQTLHDSQKMSELYSRGGGAPYPEYIKNKHSLKNWGGIFPHFSEKDQALARPVNDLELSKFVFIIAEANAVKPLPDEFWRRLHDCLKQKGIDVFVNTKTGISKYGKSASISIKQAMYLASKSKAIISIRCGLAELISSFPIQKHIIYTSFMWEPIPAKRMMNVYSLFSYPMIDSQTLHEYEWQDKIDVLVRQIVDTL